MAESIASRQETVISLDKDEAKVVYLKPQSQINKHDIKQYLRNRIPTLFPTRQSIRDARKQYPINPFPALRSLNWLQTQYFIVGFLAWTWDALDFFAVSLNMTNLSKSLHRPVKDISNAITLVLLLRVVGALIFGYLGDRYGRKYPFCLTMVLIVVIQIGTGFVKTFPAFLGCRAIFGIIMGSVFGVASATSLENAPLKARSILSGIFQQGYAFGYLLGVVFQRAIVDNSSHGWRSIFWFSAGPPVLFIAWRLMLPESPQYVERVRLEKLENDGQNQFWKNMKLACSQYWLSMIYLVLLMAGFNFSSHGSQDLFPTMLTAQYHFSEDASTVTNSVANLGAIAGGISIAHFSSFLGRRLCICICCIGGGAMLYPWGFVSSKSGLDAAVFFLQFFVQGAWGIVPAHLAELAPAELRALITGVAYQLGNMISSASSTIESTIGERFPIKGHEGTGTYNYGKVMCIFMGCVFAYLMIITILGPENKGGESRLSTLLIDDDIESQNNVSFENAPGLTEAQDMSFKPEVQYKERI